MKGKKELALKQMLGADLLEEVNHIGYFRDMNQNQVLCELINDALELRQACQIGFGSFHMYELGDHHMEWLKKRIQIQSYRDAKGFLKRTTIYID